MDFEPFHLERYFARYEFSARHLASSSDCESVSLGDALAWADVECRRLWDGLRLGYTESRGLPLLRAEIAGLYDGLSPDEVLTVVPEEGVLVAMTVLLERGDHVIVTAPGYQSLYGVAKQLGCEVTLWQPSEREGWRFDPAFLRASLRPNTRLVVVNFPHNPTGALPARSDYDEILGIVASAGVHLFSDEMYRWLEHEPSLRLPSACERYERAVTLCGMSKTFSMPGVRQGWLATRDAELYRRLAAYKDFTTICGSAPSEVLALIGLRCRERIVARNLQLIAENLERVRRLFDAWPELFSWTRPRAGSVGLVRLAAPEGALAFCERAVREAEVMLLPSTVFSYGDQHVRIGLGRATLATALDALERWLEHGRGR